MTLTMFYDNTKVNKGSIFKHTKLHQQCMVSLLKLWHRTINVHMVPAQQLDKNLLPLVSGLA